jgi:hypothetical protein
VRNGILNCHVGCDAVQAGCLFASVTEEPDSFTLTVFVRPHNGGSSFDGDFDFCQATRRHTCEYRDVTVLIFRLDELMSSFADNFLCLQTD